MYLITIDSTLTIKMVRQFIKRILKKKGERKVDGTKINKEGGGQVWGVEGQAPRAG